QTLPSGAAVIRTGPVPAAGISEAHAEPAGMGGSGYSVMAPFIVMRPILLALDSVNHSAPSGPEMISVAPLFGVGIGKMVTAPFGKTPSDTRPGGEPHPPIGR